MSDQAKANVRESGFLIYRYFWSYVRPHRGRLLIALVFLMAAAFMNVLRPWPLKIIFDYVLLPQPRRVDATTALLEGYTRSQLLAIACAAVVAISILYGIFDYIFTIIAAKVGNKAVLKLRGDLYGHVQRLSLAFHARNRSGDLLSRLVKEVNQIRDYLTDQSLQIVSEMLFVVALMIAMFVLDWRLTALSLVLFPVLLYAMARLSGEIRGLTRKRLEREGKVASLFNETLAAIQVVQLFAGEHQESEKFEKENRRSYRADMRTIRLKSRLLRLVEVISALGLCFVLWYGTRRVLRGSMTPGDLIVFVSYLRSMYRPVRRLASLSVQTSKTAASAERVMQVLQTEPDVVDLPGAVAAPRFRGAVEFRDVSFAYEPGHPVLKNINFRVAPGQTVALCGVSGAGKSTLVSLIPRLYDPIAGSVRIDSVDVRRFTLASLRDQITVVPQNPTLFGCSIRENIAYGCPAATDNDVREAARLAQAAEFIEQFPDGYDTVVGERGARLSGGERQRIAIARALLRDAPLVILDEPMTGVDVVSEGLILRALRNLLRNRTAFVIAHRFSTVLRAGVVLVLEKGEVVEMGSPQELFRSNGRFRQLSDLHLSAEEMEKFLETGHAEVV